MPDNPQPTKAAMRAWKVRHHTFMGEQIRKVPCEQCSRYFDSHNIYGGKIPDRDIQVVSLAIKAEEWVGKCGVSRQWFGEGVCTRCGTLHIVPLRMGGDFHGLIECARLEELANKETSPNA